MAYLINRYSHRAGKYPGAVFSPDQVRLPSQKFLGILVEFLGKLSHGDAHGADALAGAAIGTSSRTVISPQEVKSHGVRGINAFSHPLGADSSTKQVGQ